MRRLALSTPVAALSLLLMILTLPGVPKAVAGWGSVFHWVEHSPARWILPVIGWVVGLLFCAYAWSVMHDSQKTRSPPRPKKVAIQLDNVGSMYIGSSEINGYETAISGSQVEDLQIEDSLIQAPSSPGDAAADRD